MEGYETGLVKAHDGGRNVVYTCEKEGADAKILRIAFLPDRSREDFLGELEYIRYLFEHGGSVSDVVSSRKGNLLEEITHNHHIFFISLFKKAKGKMLVENNYQYREGAPITEYYYNCGKVLGKLHQISKEYTPIHRRYSFFDKYNAEYIDKLIPDSLSPLKEKLVELLNTLEGVDRNKETFGLNHFDYNDGNYSIDFDTGQITVYDSIILVTVGICLTWPVSGETEWAGYNLNQTPVNVKSLWRIILKQSSQDTDLRARSKIRCWIHCPCLFKQTSWRIL
ncbi:phosphotransferase [Paenibacillus sp. IHBB 3054]|uniref:phosphotransferase n=1 Tax=Paenibacillus sp. IHBB 3054 TaxID=3425689 RepID=UPI003F6702FC